MNPTFWLLPCYCISCLGQSALSAEITNTLKSNVIANNAAIPWPWWCELTAGPSTIFVMFNLRGGVLFDIFCALTLSPNNDSNFNPHSRNHSSAAVGLEYIMTNSITHYRNITWWIWERCSNIGHESTETFSMMIICLACCKTILSPTPVVPQSGGKKKHQIAVGTPCCQAVICSECIEVLPFDYFINLLE